MSARLSLVALAVGTVLLSVPVRAQDAVGDIQKKISALRQTKPAAPSPADLAAAVYRSEREAAVAFVDMVRKYPDQRMEYCAYILRGADKRYRFSPVRQGDMNHCPADRPKPADAVASVHTHPKGGLDSDPSAAGQVFSEGDYAFAESAEMNFPIYLGAPAGHVLRYAPGNSFCRGSSFVRRNFEIVRDIHPSVAGRLPVNPGADVALYTEGGSKLPKPSYCRSL